MIAVPPPRSTAAWLTPMREDKDRTKCVNQGSRSLPSPLSLIFIVSFYG
jgi:hypothetical protein